MAKEAVNVQAAVLVVADLEEEALVEVDSAGE